MPDESQTRPDLPVSRRPQAPPQLPQAAPAEADPTRRNRKRLLIAGAAVAGILVLTAVQLIRPLPKPTVTSALAASHTFPGPAPSLPWPAAGQAAIEVEGLGTVGERGGSQPIPTASVAKVMTAYVFLRDHPLRRGQDGPVYTISQEEAGRLAERKARDESLVDVVAGEPFTEREALRALLVVSANNIAHELARWDAGGDAAFTAKMNAAAHAFGMTSTTYTDPSGYDPATVSTAPDQVRLFREAMRDPAFAQIMSEPAYTPSRGGKPMPGNDTLLGQDGVVAGKTGNTDQAGANFVFAAKRRVAGIEKTIMGAVMGQPTGSGPYPAMAGSRLLIEAVGAALTGVTVATKGQRAGWVDDGLGDRAPLSATTPIRAIGWPGLTVRIEVNGSPSTHEPVGARVAETLIGGTGFKLRLEKTMHPSLLGRLTRPI